jgi:dCTP deaminase
MSVWSDADIADAIAAGRLKVTPWRPEDLTPNGLDLRVASVLLQGQAAPVASGTVRVPPLSRFVVATEEVLELPPDAAGSLWIRSSYARRGAIASFGKVDAGFRGNLTLGAFNASSEPLDVPIGDRFCQVVLEDLRSPSRKPYAGRYQDQRGVTLAP